MKLGKGIPQSPSGDIETTAEFCVAKLGFQFYAKHPEHGHLIVVRD